MTHLTPDELVDAVEGTLAGDRKAHADTCAVCRAQAAQVSAMLVETRGIDVPEPSPLFWDHFSARVHQAIAAEAVPSRRGWIPPWLRAPVLVPLGALVLLVMSLAIALPRAPGSPDRVTSATAIDASAPDLTATGVEGWAVVAELVGPIDLDGAVDAGIAMGPGTAELVALDLSTAEQTELVRLLRAEMSRQ